jgi:hypothetical protein
MKVWPSSRHGMGGMMSFMADTSMQSQGGAPPDVSVSQRESSVVSLPPIGVNSSVLSQQSQVRRVRSHCRNRNVAIESSKAGMNWRNGGAKRPCDRTPGEGCQAPLVQHQPAQRGPQLAAGPGAAVPRREGLGALTPVRCDRNKLTKCSTFGGSRQRHPGADGLYSWSQASHGTPLALTEMRLNADGGPVS